MNKNRPSSETRSIPGILWIIMIIVFFGVSHAQAKANAQESQELSTPDLIFQALNAGQIDQATANLYLAYSLSHYELLPPEYRSNIRADGTMVLLYLSQQLKAGEAQPFTQEVAQLLQAGACGSSSTALPNVYNSTHFYIEYGTIGGGLTITQYAASLEAAWNKEVTTFGWAAPPILGSNPPPGNRYHVRIDNALPYVGYVTGNGVHAGFVGNNPNTAWNDVDAVATCMVLHNNMSGFGSPAQQLLDATIAHEFNHSLQFGYGAWIDSNMNLLAPVFIEGGATWMEDEVFDNANDNYFFLWPDFKMPMGNYTASPYPYWITFRGLMERYGTTTAGGSEQVMQDFIQSLSQTNSGNGIATLNAVLATRGTNLNDAFHAYAIAVKFLKSCGGNYVYPYCFEESAGYIGAVGIPPVNASITSIGNNYSGSIADSYAINWVNLPTGNSPYRVTLQNTSTGGSIRGSVVCDKGSGTALNIIPLPLVLGAGMGTSIGSFNPTGCSTVVAVITNQSTATPSTARSYRLSTCALNTTVTISGTPRSSHCILANQSISLRYGINGGPVKVTSTNNILTSERAIFGNSFNSIVGYPGNQLTTDYWFTSYDDVGMTTFLVIGNPSTSQTAQVDVYIGGVKQNAAPYSIAPGQRIFPRYGINGGPVWVDGLNGVNVFTSERTKFGDSFNEIMGYPANRLTTDYWFTSYDDVGMITYLVIGNPSSSQTAQVDVYIGGVKKNTAGPYSIAPHERIFLRYSINGGPVFVDGINGVNIFASERTRFGNTFNEVMGYPANRLTTEYWFTSYDDVGMITYLVIGNPSTSQTAQVDVYIGGVKKNTASISIAPGQRAFLRYGINAGPVRVVSTNGVNVFASERSKYLSSFNEILGMAANQLTTEYWFTSYDDVSMSTTLVISSP